MPKNESSTFNGESIEVSAYKTQKHKKKKRLHSLYLNMLTAFIFISSIAKYSGQKVERNYLQPKLGLMTSSGKQQKKNFGVMSQENENKPRLKTNNKKTR